MKRPTVLRRGVLSSLGMAGLLIGAPSSAVASGEWPTLRGGPQRLGYYRQLPKRPWKLSWRVELWKELTGPRAEAVTGEGKCYLGSYAGVVRAWNLETGAEVWKFQTGGAIGHSVAYDAGVVYAGSLDGKLYALRARDGARLWTFQAAEGIWSAPLVLSGRVFFGDREGIFYAVDVPTGRELWQFRTGAPILTSGSATADGQGIIFASEDMHVYCVSAENGGLTWKSRKLAGLSIRDYAPVIFRGLVFVTTNPVKDFHTILGEHQQMLIRRTGFKGKDDRYIPGTEEDVTAEQDFIVDFLKTHPEEQTFYAFEEPTGREPWISPVLYTGGLHNPITPPCADPNTGDVFTFVRSAYGTWDGGGEVRPYTGVGKLDLKTGRVRLLGHAYESKEPGRPPGSKDMPWMTFNTIGDETQTLGCSDGILLCVHQGFIGSLDLKTGLTASLYGKRDTYGGFYGPGTFGWENQGGYEKAAAAGQPFGIVNEWHGPARSLISVAGRRVIFHVGSQVICLEGHP